MSLSAVRKRCRRNVPAAAVRAWVPGGRAQTRRSAPPFLRRFGRPR